ncbi:MAG: metalloregulator ArsR/SmtB family transcription factor [Acidimicrobiia bacterium]
MENCCTPLFEGVIDDSQAAEMAPVLAALADPVRLRIVSMLAAAPKGSACGCELEEPLGLSQPTVSHHLKVLREAGLVEGERRGRWIHYSVVPDRLDQIREALRPGGVLV